MICVLTLFGETDLQPVLKKVFGQNDIFFLEDNCVTSVQLTEYVEAHKKEVDAVIIYANAMNTEVLPGYIKELRSFEEHLRVILVLSGGPGQFLRSQINEYKQQKLDLIFDDDGFDVDSLVDVVKKGKLTHRVFKTKRKESGFNGDIDECKPEKKNEKPKRPKSVVAEYVVDSFTRPQGHYTVGIMNAARGAGATWTTNNLARYFAMQNYSTAIVDLSGTEAALMMKLKNIDCYADDIDIDEIKKKYNINLTDLMHIRSKTINVINGYDKSCDKMAFLNSSGIKPDFELPYIQAAATLSNSGKLIYDSRTVSGQYRKIIEKIAGQVIAGG